MRLPQRLPLPRRKARRLLLPLQMDKLHGHSGHPSCLSGQALFRHTLTCLGGTKARERILRKSGMRKLGGASSGRAEPEPGPLPQHRTAAVSSLEFGNTWSTTTHRKSPETSLITSMWCQLRARGRDEPSPAEVTASRCCSPAWDSVLRYEPSLLDCREAAPGHDWCC